MRSYIFTGMIALILGLVVGTIMGWELFPKEYNDSHLCQLDNQYKREYTLMVARDYRMANDREAALEHARERLKLLRMDQSPHCSPAGDYEIRNERDWVQYLAEQLVDASVPLSQIQDIVLLAEGFGRLTPELERYLPVDNP